jgi:hypothetical protein
LGSHQQLLGRQTSPGLQAAAARALGVPDDSELR